jgi:hypothetical protein
MSTASVSTASLFQQLQSFYQQRQTDVQTLGKDLQAGDLADAQTEFTAIQALGQSGPFANGDAFHSTQRQQDFSAIGQALQSGNLSTAQQAYTQLEATFQSAPAPTASPATTTTQTAVPTTTPQSSTEPQITLNLGALSPGEQITIGVTDNGTGGEQVSINITNPQTGSGQKSYYQSRDADLQQLGQDLKAGNLTAASSDYTAIQTLAQSGPIANGAAFGVAQRQQDFEAIGQALQSGDLASANTALGQLNKSLDSRPQPSTGSNLNPTPVAASPTTGSEIVLNLGAPTAGEQITIGVNNTGNGAEQVNISVANQQNQNPEQITLNLNSNSNEQLIINLFNSASQNSSQGGAVNLTA